jgi:hypothetical protein
VEQMIFLIFLIKKLKRSDQVHVIEKDDLRSRSFKIRS